MEILLTLGVFLVVFVLSIEMVRPEKRVFCGTIINISYVVGEILVAGLAYWLRDWRTVLLCCLVPALCLLIFWPVLPESVRSVGSPL